MLDVVRLRVLLAVARRGSLTAAAKELHYSQPSVSHHLARLEAETGAKLVQRAGRGIRLTEAGRLLADRAADIIGRLDDAAEELASHVGLRSGRVRLAAFPSALGTFVPKTAMRLALDHPNLRLEITETEPPEALRLLRAGRVDVAVMFRYDDTAPEDNGIQMIHLLDDPSYLIQPAQPRGRHPEPQHSEPQHSESRPSEPSHQERPGRVGHRPQLAGHAEAAWIAGCDRCRLHLLDICAKAGFAPRITFTSDDIVAVQALVAAGMGITVLPGLALRAHRHPDVSADLIPGSTRHVHAAVHGDPPHPPATQALLSALRESL
ncbi:LysR family transcriptional regulator [Nonomuraea glycinis]|uniref:LysR family transcriptional regulator n=1 Tax=Nonomuraea glycinis TaxID=2047744 RepID=UPI002E0E206B|nr:LysR family transcriptional regulator [Nonomuraea glycinis]